MSSTSVPPINRASQPLGPQVKFECPVCLDVFQLPEANEEIRVLAKCPHNLCHTCLVKHIASKNERKKMKCPNCRREYPLGHPQNKQDAESLANTNFLTHKEFLLSVNRNELITPFSPPQPPKIDFPSISCCTSSGCSLEATHNCLECGLQCSEHELLSHQQLSPEAEVDHTRINLEEKRREKEQKAFEQQMKEITARTKRFEDLGLKDQIRQLEKLSSNYNDESAFTIERKKYEQDGCAVYNADLEVLGELERCIIDWKNELSRKRCVLLLNSVKLDQDRTALLATLQSSMASLKNLPSDSGWDHLRDDELKRAMKFSHSDLETLKRDIAANPLVPIEHHPMVTFLRKKRQPSILSKSWHVIKRYFWAKSHQPLVGSALVLLLATAHLCSDSPHSADESIDGSPQWRKLPAASTSRLDPGWFM